MLRVCVFSLSFLACKYFDVTPVFVSMDSAMRMDVGEARRAVSRNTIVLIASAPQYPHGVVDPVVEVAALALEHNLPCHVDACMGGFLLPWVERLGVSNCKRNGTAANAVDRAAWPSLIEPTGAC